MLPVLDMTRMAWMRVALAICSMLGSGGCTTVDYYRQAVAGQNEILRKARLNETVFADADVSREVKRKLAVVDDVRAFAREELGLPGDYAFNRYTDLGRKFVSWVVYAAPEFSVEGKEWWYPIVGRLEYRGYFTEAAAKEEAARCQARGYEVFVGGVEAYSTLGWFHDPVLNTFLGRSDVDLAELILHELTHVKIFIPGDTDFNEALATASAEAGVERWLKAKGDTNALARYRAAAEKDREIIHLLLATRERLKRLYADKALDVVAMRREKLAIYRRMGVEYQAIRQRWQGDSRYDRAFAKPWNNARLNTVATYYDFVPGFQRMLQRRQGNLDAFFADVEKMRGMSKDARRAAVMKDER